LIFLLNFEHIFGYKCHFFEESVNYLGYTCDLRSISDGITEAHFVNKSDSDVQIVTINRDLQDLVNLTESEFSFCQRFDNLEKIIINNEIKSIDDNLLQNCENLKEYAVSNTEVQNISLTFFSNSTKLSWLSMTNNKFTILQQNIFSGLKNLKNLSLNKNQIKVLPHKIFNSLTKLEMLWMDYNKLGSLNWQWFEYLQNLESLSIGGNEIYELPKNIFKSLINLQFLFLHHNNLTTIHWESFPVNGRLNTIDLSYNKIKAIDEKFIDFTYIYWVDMMGNVCSQEEIRNRSELKMKLTKCLENYRSP